MLTASIDPKLLDAIFEAGADGAISRTTHPEALATLVRETVDGHVLHTYKRSGATRGGVRQPPAAEHSQLTSRELGVSRLVAAGLAMWRARAVHLGDRADAEVPPLECASQARG